jgi:superfamily II DNA or RNA helicase
VKSDQHQEEPVYGDDDRLLLLQLQTRRAMAERRARKTDADARGAGTEGLVRSEDPDAAIPERWRLVPQNVSLYDWQRECLPLWLSTGRGTVKVATGGGKTLFALAAAQALQNERESDLRLVVVVPTIPLMFQWRDEVRAGNLPSYAIGLMGGSQELPHLSTIRVLICVLNSARERLPDLVRRAEWSRRMLLVVDECHRAAAAQASRIFEAKPCYTLGLSATPEPDLDAGELPTDEAYASSVVGQALGPIIYDFSLRRSLEAGLLTPFEVWHIGLSLSPTEAAEHSRISREITDLRKKLQLRHGRSRSKQGFLAWCQTQASRGGPATAEAERFIGLANRRKRLLYRCVSRSEAALGILAESLCDREGRAILFHESIEEIESLFVQALERGMPAVLEHSQLPDGLRAENIEVFREGVARVIVSAKSLVEGFNVPSADVGVIAASSGSVRQRIQSLGRMLRRKPGGGCARVFVLYVRDTEDEAIYEKADWESVIGAERNRYFRWCRQVEYPTSWSEGLDETSQPPRIYRPPSWEVDPSTLAPGDPYPGQSQGRDVRVDQDGNLRSEDNSVVPAPRTLVEAVVQHSPHRRARITTAGHLIVRTDLGGSGEADWQFLGVIDEMPDPNASNAIHLKLRTTSGRRVITCDEARNKGAIRFALGPGKTHTPEAGQARDRLLDWIRHEEVRLGRRIRDLYWDGGASYWLEVQGERVPHAEPLPPLEFGQ